MAEWSADQLTAIAENPELFVSPLREDGTTNGTPTQTVGGCCPKAWHESTPTGLRCASPRSSPSTG